MNKYILVFAMLFATKITLMAQENIATRLGYSSDAKLLIMHADDLGVTHSVNAASIEAFGDGGISSASIMVPCPWFSEIAAYASIHPELCWGLHLTLTSEWKHYKWDGVASSDQIPSILNEQGYMYDKVIDVVSHAQLAEVELEIRAQVDKALAAGIKVSHLDSHMGVLFATPELFEIYTRVGNDYEIPVMIPGARVPPSWDMKSLLGPIHYPLDKLIMMGQMSSDWQQMYDDMVDQIVPGLNEIIVHLGYDDAEMQAVMMEHPDFGASWRQKDLNYVMSDHYKNKLKEANIQMVSWKQVKEALIENNKK
jgi:chitin disaccharide deacetylase